VPKQNASPRLTDEEFVQPSPSSREAPGFVQSSAQILTFEPGMYSVEFHGLRSVSVAPSFPLPCARLDPMPSPSGRGIVGSLSEGGWMSSDNAMFFLRVIDDSTNFLLTTYRRFADDPAPQLRIRAVQYMSQMGLTVVDPQAPIQPAATANESMASHSLVLLAHVERIGDVVVGSGEVAGSPGYDHSIEGFSIKLQNELVGVDVEYQGILGIDWFTPWAAPGDFCGSRGMSLPLRGFKIRLGHEAAEKFSCTYWGTFASGSNVGPISDGGPCISDTALTGIRMTISERPTKQTRGAGLRTKVRRSGLVGG
jgi:hypothetical protein